MYTLVIADDEVSIRDGLKCIIDWDKAGFTLIGEASNGTDTLDLILSKQPDLVLLDVHMPKMHGIDVARISREKGFEGKYIILSGYSDFKYAQSAIQYGVDYYLTKPLDEEELLQAIHKIHTELERKTLQTTYATAYRKMAKDTVLHDFMKRQSYEDLETISEEEKKRLHLAADVYQVVIYENYNLKSQDLDYDFAELLMITGNNNETYDYVSVDHKNVILLKGSVALKVFEDFLEHYENQPPQRKSPLDSLFIAYGRPVYKLADIALSYEDAYALIRRRFYCDWGQHTLGYEELPQIVIDPAPLSTDTLQEYVNLFTDHLQTFNRKKVADTLSSLENYLYSSQADIPSIKLFLTDLFLQIKDRISHLYTLIDIPFPSNSDIIAHIEKRLFLYEIFKFFSEQCEMVMHTTGNSTRDSILDDILYYIDHNYHNNIKLESIAPLFGYNSAYLGKIFNRTVGESFNSYVDHVRIDHSKELLLQNKLKVYEISELIGYKNVDYFHKKFKKYVGMSPAEFRKKMDLPD